MSAPEGEREEGRPGTSPDAAPPPEPSPEGASAEQPAPARSRLLGCGCAQLLVVGVITVFAAWIYLAFFFHPFGEVHAVVPQVRSSSVVLALSAGRLSVAVRIVVRDSGADWPNGARFGVSLGAATFAGSEGAADTTLPPFVDPVVRMWFAGSYHPDACTAPCELDLPWSSCGKGCAADATLLVEYIAPAGLPPATVTLTGTAAADLEGSLPGGASVELAVLPAIPGPTNGAYP